MKIDYSEFYRLLAGTPLEPWIELLPERIAHGLRYERHGLLSKWEDELAKLPKLDTTSIELKDEVRVEGELFQGLEDQLKSFHPWRKGPYHIHGVDIDTEWRSDWKWDRVLPHLQPLEGRTVLDVGCGNGYHCWRMVGEGAKLVVGIDPSPMFVCQFFAMKHFIQNPRAWVLPLGIEHVPDTPGAFDTVFSMGVLYHRKSPLEHLEQLKSFLKPGGELYMFEHTGSRYFPFSVMMKLMSRLTEKLGPSMDRKTVENVEKAGFDIVEVEHIFLDVVKVIKARAPW